MAAVLDSSPKLLTLTSLMLFMRSLVKEVLAGEGLFFTLGNMTPRLLVVPRLLVATVAVVGGVAVLGDEMKLVVVCVTWLFVVIGGVDGCRGGSVIVTISSCGITTEYLL